MNTKILIIAGGGKKHLIPFEVEAKKLGLDVSLASFSDLSYQTGGSDGILLVNGMPITDFNLIYIRLVGRRFEDLALLLREAKKEGIKVIDKVFTESGFARLPISKLLEIRLLSEANLLVPKTIYGKLDFLKLQAPKVFGFPFVFKLTTGKQGHGVWSPRNETELIELVEKLKKEEKEEKRFLAQEFIKAPKRIRALVVGNRVVGTIVRPTRWRKRFSKKVVEKTVLKPIPNAVSELALKATKTLMLDIAGVDILEEQKTNKLYVLEVNSAPRWEAIKRDCGVAVEEVILKHLAQKITLLQP